MKTLEGIMSEHLRLAREAMERATDLRRGNRRTSEELLEEARTLALLAIAESLAEVVKLVKPKLEAGPFLNYAEEWKTAAQRLKAVQPPTREAPDGNT